MSQLALYSQFNLQTPYKVSSDFESQSAKLAEGGIVFEQIPLMATLPKAQLGKDQLLKVYEQLVDDVKRQHNFLYADVARFERGNSLSITLRGKYLSEHTHTEHEARFLIEGRVLIYIHVNEQVHILECGPGDFILIPKAVKHWMDIGPDPAFTSIRWFNSPQGLENCFTGSFVAESTPRWETIYAEHHFDVDK